MKIFSNVKIGRKLLIMSLAGLLQLLLIAGLSLQALNDSSLAAEKAQHYAHKMDVAEKMQGQQLEMALILGGGPAQRRSEADSTRLAALRKEYQEEVEYFKGAATTAEDRSLVGNIADSFSANGRATASKPPPGGNGTTMRIGLFGYASAADDKRGAAPTARPVSDAARVRISLRRVWDERVSMGSFSWAV